MNDLVIDQQAADVSHVEPDERRQVAVRPTDPFALLVQAVDKGMDPAQLKALVDLQEQWRAARAKEAFAAAMNLVQAEMPCIVRDASNSQTKSTYVKLETIMHGAKPVYIKHGFSLSFSEDQSDKPNNKRIVCLVRHNEGHSERHWIDLPIDGVGAKGNAIGAMNPVQGSVSTGSYGQRVLVCRVFAITVADTDLDGNPPEPHRNPSPDYSAPQAPPRGQRQQPQQECEVTRDQMATVAATWKARNPDPDGNLVRQGASLATWVVETCGRGMWRPSRQPEWRYSDYVACCRALNIEAEDQR